MRHVIAISGGKDSVAMALRLAEVEPREYDYLITPTGNELPEMHEHWRRLEVMLGRELIRLQPFGDGDGLAAVIRDQGTIPNFRMRFCTRILKLEPTIKWLTEHAPCTQYVDLRADEETREGLYGDIDGVTTRHPLREWGWGIADVWDYLDSRGVTIPERTDCAWCFYQRIIEWKRLWQNNPDAYQAGVEIEQEIGHTFRSNGRDSWPASLAELGEEFASGRKVRGESEWSQKLLFDCDRSAMCRVCSM